MLQSTASSLRIKASLPPTLARRLASAVAAPRIPSIERRRPSRAATESAIPSSPRRDRPSKPAQKQQQKRQRSGSASNVGRRGDSGASKAPARSQPRSSVLSPSITRNDSRRESPRTSTARLPDLSTDWSSAPHTSGALSALKTFPHFTVGAPVSPSSTQGTTLARATFDASFNHAAYEAKRKANKHRPLRTAERAMRVHLGASAAKRASQVLAEEDRAMPGETAAVGEGQTMGDAVREARVRRERAILEKLGGEYSRFDAEAVLEAAGGEADEEGSRKWVLRDAARAVANVDRLDPIGKSWVVRAVKGEMR